jgi:hypothetical protein
MAPRHLLTRAQVRRFGALLVLFVLIGAIVNTPFAVGRLRSRMALPIRPRLQLQGPAAAKPWPAATPHAKAWPAPDSWSESAAFGYRHYDVRASAPAPGVNGYSMDLQLYGWPLPVLEQKQMWWNWGDPALSNPATGLPEPDPAIRLLPIGLVVNPLVIGIGAFAVLIGPWILFVAIRQRLRSRVGGCPFCGYPVGVSPVCTECGRTLISSDA